VWKEKRGAEERGKRKEEGGTNDERCVSGKRVRADE